MRFAVTGGHTFLFTDLVGFTALTEAEGDERGADVAIEFCERVRPLLSDHGAEEVKSIGDGLMLRSDDPALGIQLGLRIVQELEQVRRLPARSGSASTPARRSRATTTGIGNTVNVAARLCSAAGGGEVLASEDSVAGRPAAPRRRAGRAPPALAQERDGAGGRAQRRGPRAARPARAQVHGDGQLPQAVDRGPGVSAATQLPRGRACRSRLQTLRWGARPMRLHGDLPATLRRRLHDADPPGGHLGRSLATPST